MRRANARQFRKIYEAYYRAILAYALRRSDQPADAYDVLAETFLIAWRRFDDVPDGEHTLPWLYAVAHRVISNSERARRRAERLTSRLLEQPRPVADLERQVGQRREHRELVAALRRLDTMDQELIRLAAWEGLSASEMADVLRCSLNAATLRLHRARQRLADELEKETGAAGHSIDEEAQPLR